MLGRWGWPRAAATGPRASDAVLAALVVAIVGTMIVPLPTAVLDVLLAGNLAVAILLLLVAVYLPTGIAFSAFPTVLLVTTLYRLALNVSSTRLILLQADAGRVIESFGEFVVQGNYAVGGIVFLVLTLIQLVVITKGAERVAEVGARFTLDAMPGKQMGIDAELRAGTLSGNEARRRRTLLETESQFYGAMDGAMKFVKGDAVAGIAITCINVAGGFGLGILSHDMAPLDALETFGLLAIGDGLVSQLPALLISTSAGLVVTRVASTADSSLSTDLSRQIFGNRRALFLAAGFLAVLALIPGLPFVPFALLAIGFAAIAEVDRRKESARHTADASTQAPSEARSFAAIPWTLELNAALADRLLVSDLPPRLAALRDRLFIDLGLTLPAIAIERTPELPPRAFRIRCLEVPADEGTCPDDDEAANVIVTALDRVVRLHAADLLGIQDVENMLEPLTATHPALVRSLVPKPLALPLLRDVLRLLLAEGISIRPLREILEVLSTQRAEPGDPGELAEVVRRGLRRLLTHRFAPDGTLPAIVLDPEIEEAFRDGIVGKGPGRYLALAPDLGREILDAVKAAVQGREEEAVLLVRGDVRRFVRSFLRDRLPRVPVVCAQELDPTVRILPVGTVALGPASSMPRNHPVPA